MMRIDSEPLRFATIVACLSGLLLLAYPSASLAQRADRGIVSGVVTDQDGAAIPGATVMVLNEATGVETVLVTNQAGAYTTPPLVLGVYSVRVTLEGFRTWTTSGIQLQGAATTRQDATLEIGALEETIEVTAGPGELNVTTPDVSHVVDSRYYEDLPIITAGDVRLAEAVLLMQPGYLPMTPNGDPMFRGSQFNSRINGGQAMAVENFFDGAAFGYASGHQQSHESTPPFEAIEEVRVVTASYSAQYGRTSGGVIEYTSKSGTNTFRGGVYDYLANHRFNSEAAIGDKEPVNNNNVGFMVGGPVSIPGVYNGRNRTFFFTNFDWTRIRSGVLPAFANSTPIDAFKQGDFSALLTGQQIGTDALGRPIMGGQIYDPNTTRLVGGVPVRDPFPGNVIPDGHPLRSQVASQVVPSMASPDREGLFNNVAGNPAGDQTWELDARNILARVDHNFTPNFRMNHSFYWNRRPSVRNCGGVQGCSVQFDGETEPERNTDYVGEGFFQRISTLHAHQQFDWIISDNLLNHSTIAYDRWFMGGNSLSAGANWAERLWGSQAQSGLLEENGAFPAMSFLGNPNYTPLGNSWPRFGFEVNNRWQFSNDLTWVKGRHTIKTGVEYRHHEFPSRGWAAGGVSGSFQFNRLGTSAWDAGGGNVSATGDPFASFLLGQVHTANQTLHVEPTFKEQYVAAWVNDEFKMSDRLTLTLGMRLDYQTARTENTDQYSTFDPNTPNPAAGNLPGALIFAGTGEGRSGRRTFDEPKVDAWGPRVGAAYRLDDRTALRGGYGIYYAGVSFSQFTGQPTQGFQSNMLAPNPGDGRDPAFHLDDGFPADRLGDPPPFIDPGFQNDGNVTAVAPDGLTLPRFQNWSVTVQRELTDNMMLDVSYIGNRGSRLNHNWQTRGVDSNMNDPSILGLGTTVLLADINSDIARDAGFSPPYPGFSGNVAQALRQFPQYREIQWRGVPTGRSQYHALEVVLNRRFSRGLQARVAYTLSRLRNNGAESAQGNDGGNGGIQNPANPLEWNLSRDDVPHVLLTGFTWEVPGGERWGSPIARAVLGGWNVSGTFRYEGGRPMLITMDNADLGPVLFNTQRRPNRVSGVDGVASRSGGFDPDRDNFFNRDAWEDPGTLQFGNAPKRDGSVRGFPVFSEDLNIFKDFRLANGSRVRAEFQFGNLFDRTLWCNPSGGGTNVSSASFGVVNAQCNQPRSVQFGLRYDF